jgi:hypothetical protein
MTARRLRWDRGDLTSHDTVRIRLFVREPALFSYVTSEISCHKCSTQICLCDTQNPVKTGRSVVNIISKLIWPLLFSFQEYVRSQNTWHGDGHTYDSVRDLNNDACFGMYGLNFECEENLLKKERD